MYKVYVQNTFLLHYINILGAPESVDFLQSSAQWIKVKKQI